MAMSDQNNQQASGAPPGALDTGGSSDHPGELDLLFAVVEAGAFANDSLEEFGMLC